MHVYECVYTHIDKIGSFFTFLDYTEIPDVRGLLYF
jgi:hypothetical protein